MKVVFFSYDAPNHISGVDSWLKRILPQLALRGIDVSIVFSTIGKADQLEKVLFFKEKKINTYTIAIEKYTYAEQRTRAILLLMTKIKPDVIVPGYIVPAIYTIKWLRPAGVLSVCVLHSDDEFFKAMTVEFLEKDTPWKFDVAVGVSDYLYHYLRTVPINNEVDPISQIPYGVPLYDKLASFSEPLKIVYVGRLEDEQKRITDVTSAFCRVTGMYNDVRADIYGEGSLKKAVIDKIARDGNGKVHYKGYIDSENLADVLSQYHVIVLLSDYEGLPVALLEGMSCGLVPVCLNMESGINDVIKHMHNGIILNNRNSDFFEAIKLLKEKSLWSKLSASARKSIEQKYSIQATANTWIELLNTLNINNRYKKKDILLPAKIVLPRANRALAWENYHNPGLRIKAYKWLLRKLKL